MIRPASDDAQAIATKHRLADLTGRGRDVALEPGAPTHAAGGLTWHLSANGTEALLETDGSMPVRVNDKIVLEFAHVRMGSVIEAGDERFALMAPFQLHVNTTRRADEARTRRHLHAIAAATSGPTARLPSAHAEARGPRATLRSARRALLWLVAGFAGFATLILLNMAPMKPAPQAPQSRSVGDAVPGPPRPAIRSTPSSAIAPLPTAAPAAAAVTTAAVETPQTSVATKPKAKAPSRPKAAVAAAAPTPDTPELAKMRETYQEYVLEAKFDPEGVRHKVDDMLTKVPAASTLAGDLRKLRQSLN